MADPITATASPPGSHPRQPSVSGGLTRRGIGGRWHKALLTAHVATTAGVLGGDLALLALGVAGASRSDPLTIYPAAHRIGVWLVAPLAAGSLGTGLLLGVLTRWGLVTHWWVTIKLAVTAVLTGVVLFVLVPGLDRAADAAMAPALQTLPDAARLRLAIAPAIGSLLLALNVALAIYKPGWRRRAGASVQSVDGWRTRTTGQ